MNLNQVTIIGRITQDPFNKEFGDNKQFTKFTLATNDFRSKEKKGEAEYHTVVTFGKLAELCGKLLKKGRLIYIQGRLKTSRWEDSNKVLHTNTDIIANKMLLLDKQQALVNAESDSGDSEAVVELTPEMMSVKQAA